MFLISAGILIKSRQVRELLKVLPFPRTVAIIYAETDRKNDDMKAKGNTLLDHYTKQSDKSLKKTSLRGIQRGHYKIQMLNSEGSCQFGL